MPFSEFKQYQLHVSLSWREIQYITFHLQRVCFPAASSPRLFVVVVVVVVYSVTLTVGQACFRLYLLPGCLNGVQGLLMCCDRDPNVAFTEPTQRRFNHHNVFLV